MGMFRRQHGFHFRFEDYVNCSEKIDLGRVDTTSFGNGHRGEGSKSGEREEGVRGVRNDSIGTRR